MVGMVDFSSETCGPGPITHVQILCQPLTRRSTYHSQTPTLSILTELLSSTAAGTCLVLVVAVSAPSEELCLGTYRVSIFNAQNPLAVILPCVQMVMRRHSQASKVQLASRLGPICQWCAL